MKSKIQLLLCLFMLIISINVICLASDTRYIESVNNLIDFSGEVNRGVSFKDITVELTTDIDLGCDESNQWTPIGNMSNPFDGTFNGGGHTISGIYIKNDNHSNSALFGYNSGMIKNVGVKGNIIGDGMIAGICAKNIGTIFQCYNDATISGESIQIGGIAAWNRRYR